jgi:hypothetical protein
MSLACLQVCFGPVSKAAAPLSSDVASTATVPPLALSQRHFSRCGVSESRHRTIVEGDGEGGVEVPVTRYPTVVLPVPQASDVFVEGSMRR